MFSKCPYEGSCVFVRHLILELATFFVTVPQNPHIVPFFLIVFMRARVL